jgi:hypothetical protein
MANWRVERIAQQIVVPALGQLYFRCKCIDTEGPVDQTPFYVDVTVAPDATECDLLGVVASVLQEPGDTTEWESYCNPE